MFEKLMYLLAPLIDKASTLWANITGLFDKLPVPAAVATKFAGQILCLILLCWSFITFNGLTALLYQEWGEVEPGETAITLLLLAGSVAFTLVMFSLTFQNAYAEKLAKAKKLWEVEKVIQKQLDIADALRNVVIDASRFQVNEPPRAELPAHIDDWLVDQFAAEMRRVLREKRNEGRSGWNTASLNILNDEATAKFNDPFAKLVHIANYAAMLWARNQHAFACEHPESVLAPPAMSELIAKAMSKKG